MIMANEKLFGGTNTSSVNAARLNSEIVRDAKTPDEMRAAIPIKKEVAVSCCIGNK